MVDATILLKPIPMEKNYFITKGKSARYFIPLLSCIIISGIAKAQGIIIKSGSNLVLKGNVSLVINNAALHNNGIFTEGESTVKFAGHLDTVIANVAGTQTTTFYNLSVIKSAFGIALKSPVVVRNILLLSGGNIYTDSNLTLRSDVNLTARVGVVPLGSNIIGKAHVERYIPSKRAWRLLTAPVTNSNTIFNTWQNRGIYSPGAGTLVTGPSPTGASGNGLDASVQNNISIKKWNYLTQSYTNVTNTKVPMSTSIGSADNSGYLIFLRGDRIPANTNVNITNITTLTSIGSLQTGTQVFPTSGLYDGYTLIGNPYASPVDFNNIVLVNLVKRFYVWDPTINALGAFVMLDDLDNNGIFAKSVTASTQTKDIQSSQAFFVQTNISLPGSVIFTEASKSAVNINTMFRPVTTGGANPGKIIAGLYLLNTNNTTEIADGVFADFDDMFSDSLNLDDAVKFTNTGENIAIMRNNKLFSAERRPAAALDDTLYFRLSKTVKRNYMLELEAQGFDQQGMNAYLEDNFLNTSTMISPSGTTRINFASDGTNSATASNRFKIVFKPQATVLPVTLKSVTAYKNNNDIAVEWKVENEINIVQYDVEKSTDGVVFTQVHTIMVPGNFNLVNSYNWLDTHPVKGNNFYRIKTYDKSGQVTYSTIVKVGMDISSGGFDIYPNPVTGNVFHVVVNNTQAGKCTLVLTNAAGQTVVTKSFKLGAGNNDQPINTGVKLPAGLYVVDVIKDDNQRYTQNLIIK